MKKFIAFLLVVVIMSAFSVNLTYADTLIAKSSSPVNTLKEVKCLPGKNQDKVVIPLDAYNGYKFMRLNNPDRIVVDIPNTAAPLEQVKINANGKYVKTIRYAANGKSTARIVLDVTGGPQYFVEEGKRELVIYVVNQIAKNLYYYMDSTGATLVVKGAKSYSSSSYKGTLDPTGKKYTLTFASNLADIAGSKISINDAYVNYISVIKDAGTKKTSLILYAKEKFTYNWIAKKEAGGFAIKLNKASETGRGDDVRDDNAPFNVAYSVEGNCDKVSFGFIDYAGYKIERLTDPDRIVIDIPNSLRPIADNQISINSSRIKSVQYSQYDEDTIRAIVNLNGQYQYHTLENSGELALYIEDPMYKNISYSNNGGVVNINLSGINLFAQNGSAKLYTQSLDSTGKTFTVTFENDLGDLGSGILQVNDDCLSTIVIQRDQVSNKTSITLIAKAIYNYNISPVSGGTVISLAIPQEVKNIKYYNSGDRVHLLLSKVKLTEGADGSIKHYNSKYDGNKFIITFSNKTADLSSGFMNINDRYLEYVQVVNDGASGNTSIILNAKERFEYVVIYRELTKDTAINIIKPSTPQDKLVVIDAGHGGSDSGATSNGVKEKTLNFDIALRLNALLKSKGIKTYMTRQDDSYLSPYERAYIANSLKAKLFICIHNNSYQASISGTETLYYGNNTRDGFNCKNFAQTIQNNLIADLKTVNRGIVPRPDLIVLHATKMPASLAEIGFITNAGDRSKLLTEDFRQKAAQSLCDSIVESLGKIQ